MERPTAFRNTRFTRRYLLALRVCGAILLTPVLFVLAGFKECWEAWEEHAPFVAQQWRR